MRGFESHLGQLTFSFKRRESEPSQVVVLCCLALYWIGLRFNHVHYIHDIIIFLVTSYNFLITIYICITALVMYMYSRRQ